MWLEGYTAKGSGYSGSGLAHGFCVFEPSMPPRSKLNEKEGTERKGKLRASGKKTTLNFFFSFFIATINIKRNLYSTIWEAYVNGLEAGSEQKRGKKSRELENKIS